MMVLMAALAIAGCHSGEGHHDHEHEHEHAHAHAHAHGHGHEHEHEHGEEAHGAQTEEIQFSESRQERFGVKSAVVEAGPAFQIIHTGGMVLPSLGDESIAVAPTAGIVAFSSRAFAEGSSVGKGAVIASISSKELGGGDVLAKAKASYEAAKKEYERDEAMVKENIVSASHYEQSKLAYEQAKSEYEALSAAGSNGGVAVKSPLGGYVKNIYVVPGQYVESGQAIASISQNRTLKLTADVPERYAASLRTVKDASFIGADGTVYTVSSLGGKVVSYGKTAESGFIPVTFEFQNRGEITPGTYVDIYLKGASEGSAISIPSGAIIEEQGSYSVFVRLDEDCFLKKSVTPGVSDGTNTVILNGLAEGEEVVVEGAMAIKLASVAAVPAGHNHNH